MPTPSDQPPRRLLRIDDQQVQKLLSDLDGGAKDRAASRRVQRRFRYRHSDCAMRIRQPGDAQARWFRVATRNLSVRGLSVFHGGFVHPKSEILIRLPAIHNQDVEVAGVVRHSRYVRDGVYELSIYFDAPIHPETFCREAQACRVLLIESDSLVAELSRRQMQALHAVVATATDMTLAVRRLKEERFDCVLLNGDASITVLQEALAQIGSVGHFGRIVAILSSDDAERHTALEAVGFDRVLVGPLNSSLVSDLLSWLPGEPLVSSFNADPMVRDLLLTFVEKLSDRMRTLHTLMAEEKTDEFLQALRSLRSAAAGFGYEPLAAEAEKLERVACEASTSDERVRLMRNLIRMAGNVRSPDESREIST